jgi:SNF2 family DNA or RNA helicase
MLDLIEMVLADPSSAAAALQLQGLQQQHTRAFKCVRIDGTISSSAERQSRISRFNASSDTDVFLLTTQCGGVGITLNGADWWG